MKNKKITALLFSLSLVLCMLTGCGSNAISGVAEYNKDVKTRKEDTFTAAENGTYSLVWDGEHRRILLKDKTNGRVWSNVPSEALVPVLDEDGDEKANNPLLEAPILVEYIDPETQNLKNLNGYTGSLKKNSYIIEKLDNGFKITYRFKKEEISVPVTYTLGDGFVEISVDPKNVEENENKIYSVSIAPFFTGVKNGSGESIFIPSGSGAVIYADDVYDSTRSYSTPVYGNDLEVYLPDQIETSVKESCYLPVFGSYGKNGGVCGVITSGGGAASIELNYGNSKIGYSAVYPKFALRGYQNAVALLTTWKWESRIYSDNIMSQKAAVRFYPLNGSSASLTGMADIYRDYLKGTYGLTETKSETALNIKILGGAEIKKSALGIPYNSLYAATTAAQAKDIIEDIKNSTGIKPNVQLVGFGKNGTNIKKIAGGYTVSGKFGGIKGIAELADYCRKNGVGLYMDFDIITFSKSGLGFSAVFDTAMGTNRRTTSQQVYNPGTKSAAVTGSRVLIKRSLLSKSAEKTLEAANKMSLDGVALSSLSAASYSDYSEQKYFGAGKMAEDVSAVLNLFSKNGKNVLVSSANGYAAAASTVIYDTPTTSSKEKLFDCDVPFYQIVFKGYKPMSSSSLNLSPDSDNLLLRCAETGIGLQYTLSHSYSVALRKNTEVPFYASVYSDLKPYITEVLKDYAEYYGTVGNAEIIGYEIISPAVRKTVFSNKTAVIVNYGDSDYSAGDTVVPAGSYKLIKEA